jgi:hypothetical protein
MEIARGRSDTNTGAPANDPGATTCERGRWKCWRGPAHTRLRCDSPFTIRRMDFKTIGTAETVEIESHHSTSGCGYNWGVKRHIHKESGIGAKGAATII